MANKGVLVDITKCVGCGSCTVACKMWNNQTYVNPQTKETENAHGFDAELDSNTWTTVQYVKAQKDGKEVLRYVKRQCMALPGSELLVGMILLMHFIKPPRALCNTIRNCASAAATA